MSEQLSRRRFVRAASWTAAAAPILAACGRAPGGQRQEQPGVGSRELALRLWHWDSFLIEPFRRTGAEFMQRFPKLKVEVEHTPKGQYVDKLVAQVTGGAPPDAIGVSVTGDFNVIQAKGMVAPLDPLLKRDRYDVGDFLDVNLRQHRWAGKQVGLPYGWTTIAWFYNQDLFRAHGIKTPYDRWKAGSWTWDTYVDLAQHFRRLGTDLFGTPSLPVPNNSMSFPLLWSNNGDVFDAQYTKALLDQSPALETFDFMYKASQLAPKGEQSRTSTREAGKVAMWFDWDVWYQLNIKTMSFTYSLTPPPASGRTKKHVFIGNAPGFGAVWEGKNHEEAWALLKHMVATEGMRRYFLEANIQPLRKSQTSSREFWKSNPELPDPDLMFEIADARNKNGRIPPRISNFPELQAILREEFIAAWDDKQSVRDAAIKATQRATALLKGAEIDR